MVPTNIIILEKTSLLDPRNYLNEIDNDKAGAVSIGEEPKRCVDRETRDRRGSLSVHPGGQADLSGESKFSVFPFFNFPPGLVESHQVSSLHLPAPGFLFELTNLWR